MKSFKNKTTREIRAANVPIKPPLYNTTHGRADLVFMRVHLHVVGANGESDEQTF